MLLNEWAPQPAVKRRLAESPEDQQKHKPKRRFTMPGQPTVFDCAMVIPTESGAPLTPPYGIVEETDTLNLRAYFHCGGNDAVVRNNISTVLAAATTKVAYFFQDLQILIAPIYVAGGAITRLTAAQIAAAFQPAGDLAGSGLDPTDDYYLSADVAITTGGAAGKLQIPGAGAQTGMWRVLTVISSSAAGTGVSAFDDKLIIQVIH